MSIRRISNWSVRHSLAAILFLALFLRLLGADTPIIGEHAWRQADTASIARNFYEGGYRFLYPQIDWRGRTPGYVECEFPLFPFMVASLYGAFGEGEHWGRALSAFLSVLAIFFLYAIVRLKVNEVTALWSAGLLAVLPTSVLFGRAFMPESLLLAASMAGIYFFSRWIEQGRTANYLASATFVALACLVKLPALYLGAPLAWLAWRRYGAKMFAHPGLWLYAALVVVPVAAWYAHAHSLAEQTGLSFGIWGYGVDKWGNWDLVTRSSYWAHILVYRMAKTHLTWVGGAIFLIGLCMPRQGQGERLFDFWLLGLLVYLVIVGRGNEAHNYYQLPLLFPGVVYMAKVYARFLRWDSLAKPVGSALLVSLISITALSVERFARLTEGERLEESDALALATKLRKVSKDDELVIAADNGDISVLYLSHRRGWRARLETMTPEAVAEFVTQGATWIVGTRLRNPPSPPRDRRLAELGRAYQAVDLEDRYFLFRLRPPLPPEVSP